MSEVDDKTLAEIEARIRSEVEAEMQIRAQVEAEHAPSKTPADGEFRYLGVVVDGEKEDDNGNVVPNIVKSTELSGLKFYDKKYTHVPGDLVAYHANVLDKATRQRNSQPVYLVDKLRANSHFEEKVAE